MAKTIIISNRLPIKVTMEESKIGYAPSEGGLATGLGSIYKSGNNIWLGWPGFDSESKEEQAKITKDLHEENMHPVFLSRKEIKWYYEGFCNGTLWPNFHYFNQYTLFDPKAWEYYKKVNQKFADAVAEIIEPNDTIWVHDYQLLLLPQLIRAKNPESAIGFFLHIPFPSYEAFRLLPWRRELLLGMMGADLVGFHTYDDMRHFLSSVNRLAGYGNSHGRIEIDNRFVQADAFPMGIDYDKYETVASEEDTLEREERYRESYGHRKIILTIDRLDYSKGIPQRLIAFRNFLKKHPEFREKVSMVMIVVPSRDQVGKYKELKEQVDLLVGRINGEFSRVSWSPIYYYYRSFPLQALSAFYRMADVCLVNPLRDGMNLVCKEFIASKLDKTGVLILSEMAGASKELSDAILVNPNDNDQLVDALHSALTMPVEEQKQHMEVLQDTVRKYNIHHWVDLFMSRLTIVKEEQERLKPKSLEGEVLETLQEDYKKATKRLIFLDYDGTLTPFHGNPSQSKPDEELLEILEKLTADEKNQVVVISGRDRKTLDEWVGHFPVDIIGEHGVWLKYHDKDWQTIIGLENSWKKELLPVLNSYVNRTPGSFIEEKDYSLVWHYRRVETGLGELRTRELASHMKYLSHDRNLHVLEGNMVVEIKNSEVNKGVAAKKWLQEFQADFIMAVGDDWTDEDTFDAMPKTAYTIKVRESTSIARFHLKSHEDVRVLLKKLGDS